MIKKISSGTGLGMKKILPLSNRSWIRNKENAVLDIYEKINELKNQNIAAALVTVIATKGSTPREAGAKMLVSADGKVYGTIGGSAVEALMIEKASECIRSGQYYKEWHDLDDQEKEDTGMICGGKMEFFVEPIGIQPHLYIFGAGHVALPLARLAAHTGFQITIVEDRPEYATKERFPDAKEIIICGPDEIDEKINIISSDYIAIVTRSHDIDYRALTMVLGKQFSYLGLIASKVKKKQVVRQLLEEGFKETQINRIHSPIGLDIGAKTPEEIAVSIVAELIQIKNKNS